MATSYVQCYDVFLRHINDAEILYPFQGETDQEFQTRLNILLFETFKSAIVKFSHPQTKLTRDDSTQTFINDLRDIEIEIIGLLMLREYYRKQLNFLASLKQSFSDKDWKMHDTSNQMNQYRQILQEIQAEINSLTLDNSYSTSDGDLDGWWNYANS